jgi:hypothetical protein
MDRIWNYFLDGDVIVCGPQRGLLVAVRSAATLATTGHRGTAASRVSVLAPTSRALGHRCLAANRLLRQRPIGSLARSTARPAGAFVDGTSSPPVASFDVRCRG